jgi:hypothetical protein
MELSDELRQQIRESPAPSHPAKVIGEKKRGHSDWLRRCSGPSTDSPEGLQTRPTWLHGRRTRGFRFPCQARGRRIVVEV